MKPASDHSTGKNLVRAILTDIQFWIPVVVLLGGLWVLQWIR